jgi:hypothetical protein
MADNEAKGKEEENEENEETVDGRGREGKKRKREKESRVLAAEARLMALGIDVKHWGGGAVGGHLHSHPPPQPTDETSFGESSHPEASASRSVCNRTQIDGTGSDFNDVYVQFCGQRASVPSSAVSVETTWGELPSNMEERFKMSMESKPTPPLIMNCII